MQESARLWRTLAFRHHTGPAVERINRLVLRELNDSRRDLVWVDKGVFLRYSTLRAVRSLSGRMVHFTPDTAFNASRSRHFEKGLGLYDLTVTTKSFEAPEYHRRAGVEKTLVTTQGYDSRVHFPRGSDAARRREVVFAGLAEPDRERCVATLLGNGIPVRLAGHGWEGFRRRWDDHPHLSFVGSGVFGDAYAKLLSSSWIGLGLLSKRFPELHTTRTFEIPACGAVLATERTQETSRFFADEEALFFDDYGQLAQLAGDLLGESGLQSVRDVAAAGRRRVQSDGRHYESIIGSILRHPALAL